MKTITSFKIAGLITACLFAAMPTKADIGAISFKTSAAGMNALETSDVSPVLFPRSRIDPYRCSVQLKFKPPVES